MAIIILVIGIVAFIFLGIMFVASRYRRCPSDRILVVYGAPPARRHRAPTTAAPPSCCRSCRTTPTST